MFMLGARLERLRPAKRERQRFQPRDRHCRCARPLLPVGARRRLLGHILDSSARRFYAQAKPGLHAGR
jgi:hypothetical protein